MRVASSAARCQYIYDTLKSNVSQHILLYDSIYD